MTTTDRGSSVILPEVKNVGSIAGRALSDGRQLLNSKSLQFGQERRS